jgi:hypothetical protein
MSGRCSGPRAVQCRRIAQQLWGFWRTVRGGPRIPHERTALPEVQRANEAYAGPAEHAPTETGVETLVFACGKCWTTVRRTAREYRA